MLANREDISPGWKRWRVDGVDARGRKYVHGPFGGTQSDADAVLVSVSWELSEQDKTELLEWVQKRNDVSSFDYTNRDITESDGEKYIFQWFAESQGDDAMTVAWWIKGLKVGAFNSLRDAIGYSTVQGSDIKSRAGLMDSLDPEYNLTVQAP